MAFKEPAKSDLILVDESLELVKAVHGLFRDDV